MKGKMIELPIFFYTDEQQEQVDQSESMAFPAPEFDNYDDFEVRTVLFTRDVVVIPLKNGYTKIYSCGEFWICKLKYEEIKKLFL